MRAMAPEAIRRGVYLLDFYISTFYRQYGVQYDTLKKYVLSWALTLKGDY